MHALHAFKGKLVRQEQLAEEAVHVERKMIKERVGVQDQYTCACGGLVHLQFTRDADVTVSLVPLWSERLVELQEHLRLFYAGNRRYANEVSDEQIEHNGSSLLFYQPS